MVSFQDFLLSTRPTELFIQCSSQPSCFSIFRPHYLGFCGMVRIGGESGQRRHDRMAKMDNFEMHLALHRNSRRVGFVHSCALFL